MKPLARVLAALIFVLFLRGYATDQDVYSEIQSALPSSPADEKAAQKCGLPILLRGYASKNLQILRKIQSFRLQLQRQEYQQFISPSGHFVINYQTEGSNAIPQYDRNQNLIPDYLEFVANAFDRAWEIEIDSLGFRPPPDSLGNPVEQYPVFCKNLSQYGSTFFDTEDEIAALPGNNFTSFIEINLSFPFVTHYPVTDPIVRDSMAIAVTAAHEFNHALQLGYHIRIEDSGGFFDFPDLWFIESSATYMEEVVAPEVNDYLQYLPDYYETTDRSLNDNESLSHIYGEVLLDIMLGNFHGKSITREVWEEIPNQNAVASLNTVLERRGSSLNGELPKLAGWMFFGGTFAVSGKYFADAAQFPEPLFFQTESYSTGVQKVTEGELPQLAFRFYRTPATPWSRVNHFISPADLKENWFGVLAQPQTGLFTVAPPLVFTQNLVSSAEGYSYSIVGRGWEKTSEGAAESSLFEMFVEGSQQELTAAVSVYPNIVRAESGFEKVVFGNLPRGARVEIFDSSGRHVKTIMPGEFKQVAYWNLKTEQGRSVANGIYIYVVKSDQVSEQGKLIVVR